MTSDIVLSAALRSNLLSLQNTQKQVDVTQNRLATGKKVNSALDNPQSFFASQALTNRAGDLTRLLDSIGQSIQVIKAADNGISALTSLIQQADSVATSARDALAGAQAEAKIVGDKDLSGIDDLVTSLPGIVANDTLVFTVTDDTGTIINIDTYGAGSAGTSETITIATGDSTNDLINKINNIVRTSDNEHVLEASLDDSGHLQIRSLNGGDFNINFLSAASPNVDTANLAIASDLGFANIARQVAEDGAAGQSNVEVTATADVALKSFALYDSTATPDEIAQRGDQLSSLVTSTGTALFANIDAGTDIYQIGVNGGTMQNIALFANGGAITIQEFIDGINNNTSLNTKIEASFDDATGVISLSAIDSSVTDIQIGVDESVFTANFGFGLRDSGAVGFAFTGTAAIDEAENIHLAAAAGQIAQFESDFDNLRDQITQLVTNGDTGYRGTNLLNGDSLETFFNEDRTSSLTTQGATFTADGLGIDAANFGRAATIDSALEQVRTALTAVRSFGSTLANDLSVIQTRETFTQSIVNTLKEGASKLTDADQNEEGAKLLALQTRQSLGVTALSLASQSQQSILRLF